jgi:L-aspartate oxidase
VVSEDNDDVSLHAEDTFIAGAGLCHEDAVDTLVREGPDRVRDLVRLGAQFSQESDALGHQTFALGREGGHSRNRIVHAVDRTGWECERTMLAASRDLPGLQVLEHYLVLDLAVVGQGADRRCIGAWALDAASGEPRLFRASAVLLATGGCGRIYRHTTNPPIATGDGVAMAWRAGGAIANMEFIQFHPTSLYHPNGDSFLISEAVRGEGGILRTADGSTFMERYDSRRELAPRDIVARAIHAERLRRGEPCVFLDVTHLPADFLRQRFPTIHDTCLHLGVDITRQPIPVVPAAHYACGGVQTDLEGRTSIPGLYAAGEVACTGVHGANRLASNSLLEAMVFGYRAACSAVKAGSASTGSFAAPSPPRSGSADARPADAIALRGRLQALMNERVGIVRNDADLAVAQAGLADLEREAEGLVRGGRPDPDTWEARNMVAVAALIVRSAMMRKESRGLHYTTDYPSTDDAHFRRDTVLMPASDQL